MARLLDFLGQQQATYGESLTYHLAAALFYTCSRYSEIAHLRWNDCLLDGSGRIVALRIKGKGSVHSTLPVNAVLSLNVLGEWRTIQEQHRGMKVFAARGLKFCRSEYVFAGPGGEPYTNQSFNAHLGRACKDLRLQTDHSLPTDCATVRRLFCLNDQGKNPTGSAGGTAAPRYPYHRPVHPRGPRSIPGALWTRWEGACPRCVAAPLSGEPAAKGSRRQRQDVG